MRATRLAAVLSLAGLFGCDRTVLHELPAFEEPVPDEGGAAEDLVAPGFSNVRAAPAFAAVGATVTLDFDATEALPAGAPGEAPNPAVTFAGAPMECEPNGLSFSCSLVVTRELGEGVRQFHLAGADAAGNLGEADPAAAVTLDFTPPALLVSASPDPATIGAAITFTVSADEPLDGDVPPEIEATFVSNPACLASGANFSCSAIVDAAAAPEEVFFRASGHDRAGNEGTSPDAKVELVAEDLTPPAFSNFSATPSVARAGATVTLRFDSTEPLPPEARADAANPEVTFAGAPMACASNGLTHTCTLTADATLPEGLRSFHVLAADATGNVGEQTPPVSVTLDFTPPALFVSASPNPVTKGQPVTFLVTSDEPLDALSPPTIDAPFVSGTASCTPAAGGSFSCSGAIVLDAPGASGSFTATGRDLAGNEATSAAASLTLLNSDVTAPGFANFSATPSVARAGTTVTLRFDSTEPLPPDARLPATNPEVTFAGAPMACVSNGLTHTCTLAADPSLGEGARTFRVLGADATGNLGDQSPPVSVTLDFTPPALFVSASPNPVTKGDPITFLVSSNEPLDAFSPPTIAAPFVTGTPACSSAGASFACSGAIVATDAPGLAGSFTTTARDLAGNEATSAAANVTLVDPIQPPPILTLVTVGPNPATDGASLALSFEANQPLDLCQARVASQPASCGAPIARSCSCTFLVSPTVLEGSAAVDLIGTNANGTGQASTAVQIDRTGPGVSADLVRIERQPVGADDLLLGLAGAFADDLDATHLYFGRGVSEVRVWSAASGGTQLATFGPPALGADGSLPAGAIPGSDGLTPQTLAPPQLWASAVDLAGNEGPRAEITDGSDVLPPTGDAALLTIERRPLGQQDGIRGPAGGWSGTGTALREVRVYDAETGGALLGTPLTDAAGGFAELPVGSGSAAPGRLWVEAEDKCGFVTRLEALAGADALAPVVDANLLTIHRRDLTQRDGIDAGPGALTDATSAVREVAIFDDPTAGTLLGTLAVSADGSFPELLLGTPTSAPGRLWVEATDKCGLVSGRTEVLRGRDLEPPLVDGGLVSVTQRLDGSPSGYAASPGAILDAVGPVRELSVYADAAASTQLTTLLPAVDGSFPEQPLADKTAPRAYLRATDKVGNVSGVVPSRALDATVSLAGRIAPTTENAVAASLWQSTSHYAGTLGLLVRSRSPDEEATAAIDAARAHLGSGADFQEAADGWRPSVISGRRDHAMAFDSSRNRLVVFGGLSAYGLLNDHWEYDGIEWSQRAIANPPPARSEGNMVFDAGRQRLVMFGGSNAAGLIDETWEFDGSTWLQVAEVGPPARRLHSLVYDSARGKVVLFGGWDNTTYLSDTWEYDAAGWTQRLIAGPPARRQAGFAYDSARQRSVLVSGACAAACRDTWEYDGIAWTENVGAVLPAIVFHPGSVAFDSIRARVLFNPRMYGQLWEYDGSSWTEVATTRSPPWNLAPMVFDSGRGRLVTFGGAVNAFSQHTWEYEGGGWIQALPALPAGPPARFAPSFAYDRARGRVVLFGGHVAVWIEELDGYIERAMNDTWEFNGSTWNRLSPAISPPARSGHAMTYDAARDRIVLFGGHFQGDYYANGGQVVRLNDTWEFDGSTWTQVALAAPPAWRDGAGLCYDYSRQRSVLFGGSGAAGVLNDTWEYDGLAWREVPNATPPPARSGFALAYDERGWISLFGGSNAGGLLDDLWEFDGTAWTERVVAQPPPARSNHWLAFDTVRNRLLLHGGSGATGALTDTWELGAAGWVERTMWSPPASGGSGLVVAWDSVRSTLVRYEPGSADTLLWTPSPARSSSVAHAFSVSLGGGGTLTGLTATWIGAGLGDLGGVSTPGAELFAWNWATNSLTSLGSHAALDADGAAARTITASPPLPIADYAGNSRIWLLVAPSYPSSPPPGSVESQLDTDYFELHATMVLP